MPVVLAFIWIEPSIATALVQIEEDVGARVAPRQGDARVLDGLEVLVFFGLGPGGYVVVAASHGVVMN